MIFSFMKRILYRQIEQNFYKVRRQERSYNETNLWKDKKYYFCKVVGKDEEIEPLPNTKSI